MDTRIVPMSRLPKHCCPNNCCCKRLPQCILSGVSLGAPVVEGNRKERRAKAREQRKK